MVQAQLALQARSCWSCNVLTESHIVSSGGLLTESMTLDTCRACFACVQSALLIASYGREICMGLGTKGVE